ncbi:hypothetical protein C8J56DRAFT_917670 [Mycena floridula]|nr:hypothetical protein C8J56DRAFT_917670 [Mycena floridula]
MARPSYFCNSTRLSINEFSTVEPVPYDGQNFSMGSPSHYLDPSRNFMRRGGQSASLSSIYPLPPLPHATGLAKSDHPNSSNTKFQPEDIWSTISVHGHSPSVVHSGSPENQVPDKSASSPCLLSTLADMAIILGPTPEAPSTRPLPPVIPGPEPRFGPSSAQEDEEPGREKRHGCTMCHKRFDRPSTLKKHMLVHTGEKAFQCETCGRRFGVQSNLNRHIRRCVLRPGNARRSASSSPECVEIAPKPAPSAPKRRRRAPSPSVWIPDSLQGFNLMPAEFHRPVPLPLPPVVPSAYEERNSWDETVGLTPYHPKEWSHRPRLPGPLGPILGLMSKDIGNFDRLGGEGGYMIGRVAVC